jgi:uncharacterized membrane protein YeiB
MDLGDLIGPVTGEGSIVAVLVDTFANAFPYILELFALLVGVGVAMALLGRAQKGIIAKVKG